MFPGGPGRRLREVPGGAGRAPQEAPGGPWPRESTGRAWEPREASGTPAGPGTPGAPVRELLLRRLGQRGRARPRKLYYVLSVGDPHSMTTNTVTFVLVLKLHTVYIPGLHMC